MIGKSNRELTIRAWVRGFLPDYCPTYADLFLAEMWRDSKSTV